MYLSVKRLPSPWVYSASVFVTVVCSCRKRCYVWIAVFPDNALLEAFDSPLLVNFSFTTEITPFALALVCSTDTGWPF